MIVNLPDTTTGAVAKRLVEIRESGGAVTLGRVLNLVVLVRIRDSFEDAIAAANVASREHPCRVIVLEPGDRDAVTGLDAQIRVGGDAGASEVVVLKLRGELADHENSVVVPFLLPDTPVVAWWPDSPPPIPAADPVGRLAIRRITDATNSPDPRASITGRLASFTPGDSDLAWSRVTYWRALITSELDQHPGETVQSVIVSGLANEPALDILAGWMAARLAAPVTRATGELFVKVTLTDAHFTIARPQRGLTATLTRTDMPDARVSLARRDTSDCLAEELRRLDNDEIYRDALDGIGKVHYA